MVSVKTKSLLWSAELGVSKIRELDKLVSIVMELPTENSLRTICCEVGSAIGEVTCSTSFLASSSLSERTTTSFD